MASVTAITLLYPLEVMKTRIQIQGAINAKQSYSLRSIFNVAKNEGAVSLYRGFSISLVSIPVFNTIYFPIYELTKNKLKDRFGWQQNEVQLYALSAGIAGTICNFITNPLWVVRTRMQSEIFNNMSTEHFNKKYNHGIFSIYKNIY